MAIPEGGHLLDGRTAVLILWCVIYPMTATLGSDAESSVTSDRSVPAATVHQGVSGRVTSASGAPMANVFVQARSLDGPRAIPELAVMTDSGGRYIWELSAGHYELTFMRDGRELVRKRVVVRQNALTRLDVEVSAAR